MKTISGFLHCQSIVQYRIPIYEDGSAGSPEVLRKFTTEIGAPKKAKAKKKEATIIGFTEVSEETI